MPLLDRRAKKTYWAKTDNVNHVPYLMVNASIIFVTDAKIFPSSLLDRRAKKPGFL
ncbi:hypothetical protein [Microseira wollei]|uniref:hypothetical protein n=1 Tax=Microseira wollei TaxID=467598 RepID=UPI001CFD2EB8|nr:hypothetical protein [Microseira wollei]